MRSLCKIAALLLALTLAAAAVGCTDRNAKTSVSDIPSLDFSSDANKPKQNLHITHLDKPVGYQLDQPVAGEQAAVLHTNMGDIYIRLLPDAAPKAVENFVGLIEKGYYNGLIFHRVEKDFCVQGGDPEGNGTGGESLWGADFPDEFCSEALNLSYSVAMANSGVNTNGSQFFINVGSGKKFGKRADYDYDTVMAQYQTVYDNYAKQYGSEFTDQYSNVDEFIKGAMGALAPDSRLVPDAVWDLYEQYGGNIHLDGAWRSTGGHTVFGQVYKGKEVVDKINAVAVDENSKPTKDVVIKTAEVITVS